MSKWRVYKWLVPGFERHSLLEGVRCAECGRAITDEYVLVPESEGDTGIIHCVSCGTLLHETARLFL